MCSKIPQQGQHDLLLGCDTASLKHASANQVSTILDHSVKDMTWTQKTKNKKDNVKRHAFNNKMQLHQFHFYYRHNIVHV